MDLRGYQQYKEQSVSTMTPGELLMLLYDELVKRAMRAEMALQKQEYPLFEASVDRCVDIIHYLSDTLDHQYEVSHGLSRLYEYFCFEFVRIKIGRNLVELQRIKPMLADLRDTFRTASKTGETEQQAHAAE